MVVLMTKHEKYNMEGEKNIDFRWRGENKWQAKRSAKIENVAKFQRPARKSSHVSPMLPSSHFPYSSTLPHPISRYIWMFSPMKGKPPPDPIPGVFPMPFLLPYFFLGLISFPVLSNPKAILRNDTHTDTHNNREKPQKKGRSSQYAAKQKKIRKSENFGEKKRQKMLHTQHGLAALNAWRDAHVSPSAAYVARHMP
jgi:hypothetical protein